MFLDGQLRTLETKRQSLLLRDALLRRLVRLEIGLARAAVRRSLTDLRMGATLAGRLLGLLRGR